MRSLLCVVALAALGLCIAGADTYSLERVESDGEMIGMMELNWSSEMEGLGDLPEFRSETVWFAELSLADSEPMLMAADPSEPKLLDAPPDLSIEVGKPPDPAELPILYLDLDRDRNLDDEKPLTFTRKSTGPYSGWLESPAVAASVVYTLDDGRTIEATHRFRLVIPSFGMGGAPTLMISVEDEWEGKVKLGDKSVTLRLTDRNGDAKYGSPGLEGGDSLWLDADGDGQAGPYEQMPVTKFLAHGGKYYSLKVRPDGAEVTIEPYEGNLGKLIFWAKDGNGKPVALTMVVAYGDSLCLIRQEETSFLRVPPGSYLIAYGLGRVNDDEPQYQFRTPEPIEVAAGAVLGIRCGLKLGLDVEVGQSTDPDGGLMVDVNITPIAEETGHAFAAAAPGDDPGKVQLIDASGKVVGEASASYG